MMDVLFWAFIYGAMIPVAIAGFFAAITVVVMLAGVAQDAHRLAVKLWRLVRK